MDFLGLPFTNAYEAVGNVVMYLEPKESSEEPSGTRAPQDKRKAFMLVAHYDSPISSTGASGVAACCRVKCEVSTKVFRCTFMKHLHEA